MTTLLRRTGTEPRVTGQTFAALGSIGIGILGVSWAVAASEHAGHAVTSGTALDRTGALTVLGGLLLVLAAYRDHHRPSERS